MACIVTRHVRPLWAYWKSETCRGHGELYFASGVLWHPLPASGGAAWSIGALAAALAARPTTTIPGDRRCTAQQSSGNRVGYDGAKLGFYESSRGLTSWAVEDRAIYPRLLLSATQSVPRACIVNLKLASASASAYRRSRGVEHVFDLTGWASTAAHWRRAADPPASTDRRAGRARFRARCNECL